MISGVAIENLALTRGDRLLFEGFSAQLAPGEAATLVGANGAGKTSILRCVAGFIRPHAGTVTFGGADPDEARGQALHFVGHQDGLKSARTASDEITFQARWTGGTAQGVERAIETLALGPLLNLEVRKLSAGQRRRLALGRLIASPRPLWLLDEPMAPLDAARREMFGKLMAGHLAGGGMILAAVHDPLPVPARALEVGG
ncbi:MAG: heme ABC exporter ATP-binding protein CcmA [Alphaproteobacteria bacterium]